MSNVWYADRRIPEDVISCFDPLGNAVHTALSFDLLGEDVLITGCGPIGCMAIAVAKHAGARYVVATDVNPYPPGPGRRMGATVVLDARTESLEEAQKQLGMKEGFDVGSGNVRQSGGISQHAEEYVPWRENCHAGHTRPGYVH